MIFSVKDDLRLIRELKLTPKQLMFIKMLIPNPTVSEGNARRESYALSLEFQDLCPLTADELLDLISRDIILDLNDGKGPIYYDCYEINHKYMKLFSLKVTGKASQLVDAYPFDIDNGTLQFKSKDAGPEEIAEMYLKAIHNNDEEHERVMDDLEWAKKNNALSTGIKKFVATKYWLHIRELRKKKPNADLSHVRIG